MSFCNPGPSVRGLMVFNSHAMLRYGMHLLILHSKGGRTHTRSEGSKTFCGESVEMAKHLYDPGIQLKEGKCIAPLYRVSVEGGPRKAKSMKIRHSKRVGQVRNC